MEWTELILKCIDKGLEHLVQFVRYIVWPATVFGILVFFKKETRGLIDRFTEYEGRHGIFRFSTKNKPPTPQLPDITGTPPELSDEAKKILATLWERQTYHFNDDFSRRWSFRILPNSEKYGIFMLGFAELLKSGLVSWTMKDGHAILTDKGIEYLKKHPEIQNSDDIYRF